MDTLTEFKNIRSTLERQIENSRNTRQDLIDDLEEIESKITYIESNERSIENAYSKFNK